VRASSKSVTTQALLTCPKTSMSDQRTATSVVNTANCLPPVGPRISVPGNERFGRTGPVLIAGRGSMAPVRGSPSRISLRGDPPRFRGEIR